MPLPYRADGSRHGARGFAQRSGRPRRGRKRMTSFAHQAAQIDTVALALPRGQAAGLQGADYGREDADRPVEPHVPAVLPQRPLRAAQEAAGAAAQERARRRPRIPRHEGAGGYRRAGAAHAAPVRGRQRHRHGLLRHGVRRRHRVLGPVPAGAGKGAAHQGLRRGEPGAGRPASGGPGQGGARRLRQGRQLLCPPARPLDQAVPRVGDRAHRGHGDADQAGSRRTSRPTTAAPRSCTATIASTT